MTHRNVGFLTLLVGVVVICGRADGLRGSALVAELKAKAKAALLNPTETVEEVVTVEGELAGNATNVTVSKTKSLLTGIPQKDYIYDPNLPRELNGYNLTHYPFYNGVPEDIDFKCDDLHDGFYASVPHKCQVYHHCLFGTRYDFLCANYTAFDQRTFICHFVSEVDCDNSPKFFQRNEALYKAASTAPPPTTSTTTTPSPPPLYTLPPTQRPRHRRPYRRRRPVYEYYYDDQYDDEEYYDDDPPPPRRKMNRKHRPPGGHRDEEDDYYDGRRDSSRGESSRGDSSKGEGSREGSRGEGSRRDVGSDGSKEPKPTLRVSGPASGTVYDRPRVPPKIRRPVPIHERDKYDYTPKSSDGTSPSQDSKKSSKPQSKHEEEEEEYYDDEYEDEYVKPPPKRGKTGNDYGSESAGKSDSRRSNGRYRPRQHSRRRPDRYEDDYEEERSVRPRKRPRIEDQPLMSRGNRGSHRGYSREEPDPVPAERPGFISSGRFSSGTRRRAEEERTTTTRKPPSRVVYDDEEEEEYYDDDDYTQEDEVSQKNHKPPSHTGSNSRRNDDYETDSGRKHSFTSRKQSGDSYVPKPTSRSDLRSQPSGSFQGDSSRNENGKSTNRQKTETTTLTRSDENEQCKNNCEDNSEGLKLEKKKGSDGEVQNQNSDRENQKQATERDRIFSSRFDSRSKQQNYSPSGPGRSPSTLPNYRTTTQSPDPPQRSKPASRLKSSSEEAVNPKLTTTSTSSSEDYLDESSTNKYSNFRSKGRVIPPTPLINNYKPISTTQQPYETPENSDSSRRTEAELPDSEEPVDPPEVDPAFVSQKPFNGLARRPTKPTTELTPFEDPSVFPKTYTDVNYRQSNINIEDEREFKKPTNPGQNYRRVKIDRPQVDNGEYNPPKSANVGNSFRRPSKPVEESRPEEPSAGVGDFQNSGDLRKGVQSGFPDKSQQSSLGYGGAYRRVKVNPVSVPAPESEVSTSTFENTQPLPVAPVSTNVNNYKRPYLVARPLNNYPVVVEDSTKNTLSLSGPFRRPIKQRIPDAEGPLAADEYNPSSDTSGVKEGYRKVESNSGVQVRPNIGYFSSKGGKIRIDDSSARGLEQYPKQLSDNQENQFSKQSSKIEITAPGPSAPGADIASVKSNYKNDYNNAPPVFPLDIPEEEYDVTLNDALQPSTLHPTRSLVDYQQARLKTRDYQSNLGRTSEYVNRGRVSYLLPVPAASHQYITRVQSVYSPDKQEENPTAARYPDKNGKKTSPLDQEEYDAVVLTAPSDQWPDQSRNRPTEWYW